MSSTLERKIAIIHHSWLWICHCLLLYWSVLLAMNSVSYFPLQKRLSIPALFDGAITHVKSALQFPLPSATTAAPTEMPIRRGPSPAIHQLRGKARSETPTSRYNDRNLATPTQVNLYPIDGSPGDGVVESDMIDIGFYASIGYPVNRSLAMDGGVDTPGGQEYGNINTPRHKLQNRNATVGIMATPPMTDGAAPRTTQVISSSMRNDELTPRQGPASQKPRDADKASRSSFEDVRN